MAQLFRPNGTALYRIPGTPDNEYVANDLSDKLRALGYDVHWQNFTAAYGCVATPMHNVIAERNGTSGRIVMFVAHYDTRPIADDDPDPKNRDKPILGASDGASGVGVLMELARVLPASSDTVRFVLFDGEDGGGYKGPACRTDWILGSTEYARSLNGSEVASVRALVLVDMVGDANLTLPREGFTAQDERSAPIQAAIYAQGRALGYTRQFPTSIGPQITDDHKPFLDRGIPSVDLIHLVPPTSGSVFPSWHHTLADNASVVNETSLDAVGDTLEAWFVASDRGRATAS